MGFLAVLGVGLLLCWEASAIQLAKHRKKHHHNHHLIQSANHHSLSKDGIEVTKEKVTTVGSVEPNVFRMEGPDSMGYAHVSFRVSKRSKANFPLGAEEQMSRWYKLDKDSQLRHKGFSHFTPVASGFVFKHESATRGLKCLPAKMRDKGRKFEIELECQTSNSVDMLSFLELMPKPQPWAAEKNDQLPNFWHQTCDTHVPYCNTSSVARFMEDPELHVNPQDTMDEVWGSFDFPMFAVNHLGYFGCPSAPAEDYCLEPVAYTFLHYPPATNLKEIDAEREQEHKKLADRIALQRQQVQSRAREALESHHEHRQESHQGAAKQEEERAERKAAKKEESSSKKRKSKKKKKEEEEEEEEEDEDDEEEAQEDKAKSHKEGKQKASKESQLEKKEEQEEKEAKRAAKQRVEADKHARKADQAESAQNGARKEADKENKEADQEDGESSAKQSSLAQKAASKHAAREEGQEEGQEEDGEEDKLSTVEKKAAATLKKHLKAKKEKKQQQQQQQKEGNTDQQDKAADKAKKEQSKKHDKQEKKQEEKQEHKQQQEQHKQQHKRARRHKAKKRQKTEEEKDADEDNAAFGRGKDSFNVKGDIDEDIGAAYTDHKVKTKKGKSALLATEQLDKETMKKLKKATQLRGGVSTSSSSSSKKASGSSDGSGDGDAEGGGQSDDDDDDEGTQMKDDDVDEDVLQGGGERR